MTEPIEIADRILSRAINLQPQTRDTRLNDVLKNSETVRALVLAIAMELAGMNIQLEEIKNEKASE